jgi:hypothetical protein
MKKFLTIILLTAIIFTSLSVTIAAGSPETGRQTANGSTYDTTLTNTSVLPQPAAQDQSNQKAKSKGSGLALLESLEVPGLTSESSYSGDHYYHWSYRDQDENNDEHRRRYNRFRGHWTGIEFGFNNYTTSPDNMALPSSIDYMTLQSGKSSNFNINFTQLSLGLTRHFGFVTGLGLNWNNYRFNGNNSIVAGPDGVIEELDPGVDLKKSKLATIFLTIPFMLELQIPAEHNHLTIAAGPIAAIKLSSHTKMVFDDGHTIKSFRDFSLNMLRHGFTARVGYGNFMLYGTYYVTPLFQTGKGPGAFNLHPFEVGLALTFNN